MPKLCSTQECTGCAACFASCHHDAITMQKNNSGFLYPHINYDKCIECKLCEKKCPIINDVLFYLPTTSIACYNKDYKEQMQCASGGIGTLLATNIIAKGGIVYGCAFEPPFKFMHIRCNSYEDIQKIKNSKYVQSEITGVYSMLKNDLTSGKTVLFIGTPCQVAAIKSLFYLKYDNLFLVDIVCHGISSKQYLAETLPFNIIASDKKNILFRNNSKYNFSILNKQNQIIFERPLECDMYMKGFFNGVSFRPSCHLCHFAKRERVSDLTIGDFWGVQSKKLKKRGSGISLVLTNTKKGINLFNDISNHIEMEERPIEEAYAGNEQLNHPFYDTIRAKIFRYVYKQNKYHTALWFSIPDKILAMKIKYYFKHNK
ncbi:Coenzyme F420 hydrogenase/dehydrogenase, beta subunit C-terminal domain [Phocaeicola vulgatus]|uniref:Coenzyme F420 hydrogenase/dehydrogenase, beta subunit C-terminal domain n=1 Tax=Phocaeicola vulgatus TaxID=821 RepID=UPI003567CE38